MSERIERLALLYTCPYCLATPDVWCRTNRGAKATGLHLERMDPVQLAWLDGWEKGRQDQELMQERQEDLARERAESESA